MVGNLVLNKLSTEIPFSGLLLQQVGLVEKNFVKLIKRSEVKFDFSNARRSIREFLEKLKNISQIINIKRS